MGQIRHGCATTTHAIRAAIQRSQTSNAELSRELGINPKTVAKWRKRQSVEDRKTGPKEPRSTVLSEEDEAVIVAFRRHTLLPLDDCLYALQPTIPHLTRSSLHRCLQRHGISRLPEIDGDKPKRQKFKRRAIEGAIGSSPMASRSAFFTSTSPSCGQPKASSISLWPLTERASSLLRSWSRRQTGRRLGNSWSFS